MGNICSCFGRKKTSPSPKHTQNIQQAFAIHQNSQKPTSSIKYAIPQTYSKAASQNILKQSQNLGTGDRLAPKRLHSPKLLPQSPQQHTAATTTSKQNTKISPKSLVKKQEACQYQTDQISCLEHERIENLTKGRKVISSIVSQSRQILIRSCKKSQIFILASTNSLHIDRCSDTVIFCAPCSGKVVVSDCRNMKLVLISSELEVSKSKQCEISLFCENPPVLMKSSEICFSNFPKIGYYDLMEQINRSGLEVWNNRFLEVEDRDQNIEQEHFSQKKYSNIEIDIQHILEEQCFEKADPIIPMFWRDASMKKRGIVLIMNDPIREIEIKLLKYIISYNVTIYKAYKGPLSETAFDKIKGLFPHHEGNQYLCLMVGKELETSGFQAYFERVEGQDARQIQKLIFLSSSTEGEI